MLFLCLQAFFCGRSDYFRALLEDHFSEGEQLQSQPSTLVITLHNVSHEIFIDVMYYIYTNNVEVRAPLFLALFCYQGHKRVVRREKQKSPLVKDIEESTLGTS